jgi:hypothetical protein
VAQQRFDYLRSDEEPFHWAQKLVDDLNRLQRLWDLANMDLTGQAGKTVKVKADETGFELV